MKVIAFIVGFCVFTFAMFVIIDLYKELLGYDLLSDNEDGIYSPPFAGLMKYVFSASLGSFVGGMLYYHEYKISNFDDDLYFIFLVVIGSTIFIIFNLIKEIVFAPYMGNEFINFAGFILDAFFLLGIWRHLNQVRNERLAK